MGREERATTKKMLKVDKKIRHYSLSKASNRKESAYDWFKRPVTDYGK